MASIRGNTVSALRRCRHSRRSTDQWRGEFPENSVVIHLTFPDCVRNVLRAISASDATTASWVLPERRSFSVRGLTTYLGQVQSRYRSRASARCTCVQRYSNDKHWLHWRDLQRNNVNTFNIALPRWRLTPKHIIVQTSSSKPWK